MTPDWDWRILNGSGGTWVLCCNNSGNGTQYSCVTGIDRESKLYCVHCQDGPNFEDQFYVCHAPVAIVDHGIVTPLDNNTRRRMMNIIKTNTGV